MTAPTTERATGTLAVADTARNAQLAIRTRMLQDAAKLWPLLDGKRLDQTFPGWLQAMKILLRSYRSESSVAAGAAYRVMREHATQSPAPQSLIRLAPPAADEWLAKALGYSGPGLLNADKAKPGTALSTTLGTASRIVLDAGRTTTIGTVHADPVAVGWYRLTDGHPCAFCALLASRGLAYKSERTADFQAHNDCGCSAAPAFTRDQQLPAISDTADRVYREATKGIRSGQQLTAFRKAWAEHQAQ